MNMKIEEEIDFPPQIVRSQPASAPSCSYSRNDKHTDANPKSIPGTENAGEEDPLSAASDAADQRMKTTKKKKKKHEKGENKPENSLLAILFIFFFHFRATLKSRQVFNVHGDESHLWKPILLRGAEDPANYTDVKQRTIRRHCLPATAEEY